jgi:PIN domain nuclease of toxin-antitoxin system
LKTSFEDDGIQLQTLTVSAAVEANRLPEIFHRDPVDRILVATARQMDSTLLTRDDALLAYAKQGHLRAKRI